jgi:hypothetical protein
MEKLLQDLMDKLRWMLSVLQPMEKKEMLWDTPEHSRYNVRKICDEMGLSAAEKNLICACIFQESGFLNTAVCHNKNSKGEVISSDHGIVQINTRWHIGEGKTFPSVEYVVNNPEIMVRWMISMYKKGLLRLWVSYTSGAYKRWLVQESRRGIPY